LKNIGFDLHFHALPALISIHGVVSSDDSGDLANANLLDGVLELLHVTSPALRFGIAAITKEVNEHLGYTDFLGKLEEGVQVSLLGVNATVTDKALLYKSN
jgi:hypothetical protein